ncbi:MAG: hypothetical protein IKP30_07205 [Bacteroidaceae bacterium]|nr:hypothetical protein [Bacteroidaceae bacterium]
MTQQDTLFLQKRYLSLLPSKAGQLVSIKGRFRPEKHTRNSILSIVHPQKRSSQPSGKFGLQHRFEAFFPEKCNKTLPSQTCSPAQRLQSACETADE